MRKLMMRHNEQVLTVEEMQAIDRQIKAERLKRIRTFVESQFAKEEVQEVSTSSSQPQRYEVRPGQEVPKQKAPPPELPLREPQRVPKPPKVPPPIAPQESATPKLQASPTNPIRHDGNIRIIIDTKPLTSTEVSPYKRPPIPRIEETPQEEMRIQEMRTALYEKRRTLPDGTTEVVTGHHKILVQAIVGKGGTPSYKVPPKEMPAKAVQDGSIEEAVEKALPAKKAAPIKAPPSVSIPMPVWNTKSPPPKKEDKKEHGLS